MHSFHQAKSAHSVFFPLALAAALTLFFRPAGAFVFLDTSIPADTARSGDTSSISPANQAPAKGNAEPAPAAPERDSAIRSRPTNEREKFGNVLFLSADNKLVYAYVGVLKALEEFGLEVDLVLAESKAVYIGSAWALGYDAKDIEKNLSRTPLEKILRPSANRDSVSAAPLPPQGPDPLQWEFPLGIPGRQSRFGNLQDVRLHDRGGYLSLSWAVARLTHDAPGGPVGDFARARRRLAVQVADLSAEQGAVLTEGDFQNVLKGSLLPAEVVRSRRKLWPFASGALVSGHSVMSGKLPFDFERLIVVQPSHRLRPPALESGPMPYGDSLSSLTLRNAGANPGLGEGRILRIELSPDGGFNPAESDPGRWIELGYRSTLRTMDILKSVLASRPDAPGKATGSKALGLNRLSVNPLASGGREHLLDMVRAAGDSTGEVAIESLEKSGFYSDLDLEWVRSAEDEDAALVFDAREKSKLRFRAGWNAVFTGEDFPERSPELYGGMSWSEPFYIPFQAEAGALLGGHSPGYEARVMIAPVHPLHLELGFTHTHWEILYPKPRQGIEDLGVLQINKLHRDLSEVFLKVFPFRNAYLHTSIQKHEMNFPSDPGDPEESSGSPGEFLSTDFQETAYFGLGKARPSGQHPNSLRLRYRNHNRVNTIGTVKHSTSSIESRARVTWGDFQLTNRFFWSNQENEDFTPYDLFETGRLEIFTFQDEYFFYLLRSANFHSLKAEYAPVFGRTGLRLIAGGFQHLHPVLFGEQAENRTRFHWEAQAGLSTPLGILRAGAGGLDGEKPVFYLRIGAGLGLGFDDRE